MMPKNVTLFRISETVAKDLKRLPEALPEFPLRECGPLEVHTRGFVSPTGTEGEFSTTVGGAVLLALASESKLLPASVVSRALKKKVVKIEEEEGRKVGARERKRLKEDLVTEMLPRALIQPGRTDAWIDLKRGFVCVDSASRKGAESFLTSVREALGTFPALPMSPERPVRATLTDWLATGKLPEGWSLGDECELKDTSSSKGAVWRGRRESLDSEEVREHLRGGKQVTQLGLVYRDRLSFVLDEALVVRKLGFLDVAMEDLQAAAERAEGDLKLETEARAMFVHGEVGELLDQLDAIFGLARPSDDAVLDQAVQENKTAELAFAPVVPPRGDTDAATLEAAKQVLLATGKVSISSLQRALRIGYNRTAQIIEALEAQAFVSPPDRTGTRTILAGGPRQGMGGDGNRVELGQ
ncbi:recombination-associated protein RdgC [Rhodanobacter sp. FW510-R10]|uniref:recombination-associated protein RdgC n=1 Tax=Rhodanobacter sp. FW510-R10 TaxID=1524462 RepID=UPI0009EE6479